MTAMEKHFSPSNRKRIRLGELFMMAGILTENDILNALEYGLISTRPLGDVLVEMGLLTRAILQLSLNLQDSLSTGELDLRAALDALCYVAGSKQSGIELPVLVSQTAAAAAKTTTEAKTSQAACETAETTAQSPAAKTTSSTGDTSTGVPSEMESPTHEMTSADQHTSSPASSDVAAQSQAQSNNTSETTAGDAKTNITAASSKQKLTDLWGLGSDDDTARPLPKIKKKKTIESRQAAANNPNNQTFTPEATPPSPAENRKTETNKRNSDAIDIQIPDTEFVLDNDPEKRLEEEEQRFERQFNQARRPPQQAGSIKLGELLTMSGFIEESDINQAIELAGNTLHCSARCSYPVEQSKKVHCSQHYAVNSSCATDTFKLKTRSKLFNSPEPIASASTMHSTNLMFQFQCQKSPTSKSEHLRFTMN